MSEQALRRLLAVVILLGAAYLVVSWFSSREPETGEVDPVSALLAGVSDSTVRAIRIRRPDFSVELARTEEGWRANRYDADTSAVGHLFRTLSDARVADLVSRNPANHPSLGVDADSAWFLRFVTGEDSTPPLLVGKEGPYDPSSYARVAGDDRVYVLRGRIRSVVGGAMIQWRDKTVAEMDTAAVRALHVRRGSEAYRLAREGGAWTFEDGGIADAEAVRRLLGGLARTEGHAFASDPGSMGDAVREVVALGAGGDTLGWIRAAPSAAGSSWLARSSRGDGAVYRVGSGPLERVSPPRDSLAGEGGEGSP